MKGRCLGEQPAEVVVQNGASACAMIGKLLRDYKSTTLAEELQARLRSLPEISAVLMSDSFTCGLTLNEDPAITTQELSRSHHNKASIS